MDLTHTFSQSMQGDVSLWFYDVAPGSQTLYDRLVLSNPLTGWSSMVSVEDYDAYCYHAALGNGQVGYGPNANCGIYPNTGTTDVPRTQGWHEFGIDYGPGGATLSIDGSPVFAIAGNYSFTQVDFSVFGPYWRPNTVAYVDDFNINAYSATTTPEPSTLLLLATGVVGVLTRRRKSG
jgi:hypothetical protein